MCYRKGNDPYCNHSHTIKISKSKKTIFWINHKHWIHSSMPHKPQIHSSTWIFWSSLTRLLLYRTLNREAPHCCFLLKSCKWPEFTLLTHHSFSRELSLAHITTHIKEQQFPRMKRVVKLIIGYPRFLQEKRSIHVEAQAQGYIWQHRNTASFAMQAYQYRCSSTILVTALETALSCGPRCLFKFTPSFSSKKSIMNSVPDTFLWLYSIQGIFPWGESFPSK